MKLIDRYEFADGKRYETYHLELKDARRLNVPECDVLGLLSIDTSSSDDDLRILTMRPDEALIQARMLIDAVRQVSEGYAVNQPKTEVEQACGKWMSNTLAGMGQPLPDDNDNETKAAEAFAERAWSGNG